MTTSNIDKLKNSLQNFLSKISISTIKQDKKLSKNLKDEQKENDNLAYKVMLADKEELISIASDPKNFTGTWTLMDNQGLHDFQKAKNSLSYFKFIIYKI